MLRFTAAGVVSAPDVLQLRVGASASGAASAGAPTPERALEPGEVIENLRFFTEGQRGPRGRPVREVVLSGGGLLARGDLAEAVATARKQGVERVTAHLGAFDRLGFSSSPLSDQVDVLALSVASAAEASQLSALAGLRQERVAVVLLTEAALPDLLACCERVAKAKPSRVVLTWPLVAPAPAPAEVAAPAAEAAVDLLLAAGVDVGLKGLPACRLTRHRDRMWRSRNRWYVDAGHQRDKALLFFPDVTRFAKVDACRFCSWSDRCDGAPYAWLSAGLAGTLTPL